MALTEHLELAEPFEKAGFTPPQAQALAGLIGVINRRFDGLETEMRTRFGAVDQRLGGVESSVRELRSEMRDMRSELHSLPWKMFTMMLGLLTAFTVVVLGAVKLFIL